MSRDAILKKSNTHESWSHEASDFINKCLTRNPAYRLGVNGTNEIKSHVWFKEFDWVGLSQQKIKAPLQPIPLVNYFDEKSLLEERVNQLKTNANKDLDYMNQSLINDFEYQKIYQNYYFNIDEERIREQKDQDAEMALKDNAILNK